MRDVADRLSRLRSWWKWDVADRRVRVLDRFELVASIVSVLLMVAMFLWVHHQGNVLGKAQTALTKQQQTLNIEEKHLDSQELSLVEGCRRLQIVRVEQNAGNYHQYQVDRVVLVETEIAAKSPAAPVTAEQRAFDRRFLVPLRAAVQDATWVPRTDCSRAVNLRGVKYRSPGPVHFRDRTPPRDAVTVLPGDYR